MKKCEVCGLVSEPKAETCPACGEASWCVIASTAEEPKAKEPGAVKAPEKAAELFPAHSGKRGGR